MELKLRSDFHSPVHVFGWHESQQEFCVRLKMQFGPKLISLVKLKLKHGVNETSVSLLIHV